MEGSCQARDYAAVWSAIMATGSWACVVGAAYVSWFNHRMTRRMLAAPDPEHRAAEMQQGDETL